MYGTSDSSPSPDNHSEKRRNRRPDLALYVPPGSKPQILRSSESDASKSIYSSRKSSKSRERQKSLASKNVLNERSVDRETKVQSDAYGWNFKPALYVQDDRTLSHCQSSYKPDFSFLCVENNLSGFNVSATKSANAPKHEPVPKEKAAPLPRPNPLKLPQNQIEAMLKKYNIVDSSSASQVFRIPSDNTTALPPMVNTGENCNQKLDSVLHYPLKLDLFPPTVDNSDLIDFGSNSSTCSDKTSRNLDEDNVVLNELEGQSSSNQIALPAFSSSSCASSDDKEVADPPLSLLLNYDNKADDVFFAEIGEQNAVSGTVQQHQSLDPNGQSGSDETASNAKTVLSIRDSEVVKARGLSQSSNSSFYSASTTCSNSATNLAVFLPGSFTGNDESDSHVMQAQQSSSVAADEDDQILSSLPKSYFEFIESKDSSSQPAVPRPLASQASYSPSQSSHNRTSSFSCGRQDLTAVTSSDSSSVDPDDLEVQMINESFEDQIKQAQVLSDQKTKEAFYRQPNSTTTTKRNNSTSSSSATTNNDDLSLAGLVPPPPTSVDAACHNNNKLLSQNFLSFPTKSANEPALRYSTTGTASNLPIPIIKKTPTKEQITKTASNSDNNGKGLTWAGWGGCSKSSAEPKEESTNKNEDLPSSTVTGSKMPPTSKYPVSSADTSEEQKGSDFINFERLGEEMIASLLYEEKDTELELPNVAPTVNCNIGRLPFNQNNIELDAKSLCLFSAMPAVLSPGVSSKPCYTSQVFPASASATTRTSKTPKCINVTNLFSSSTSATTTVHSRQGMSDLDPTVDSVVVDPVVERWEDIDDATDFIPIPRQAVSDFGVPEIPKPIDYLKFDCKKNVQIDPNEFGHIIEAYGFPAAYRTVDSLCTLLQPALNNQFRVEFVDESHALLILANENVAFQALQYVSPVVKLRTLHEASAQSKRKAKENSAQMMPFKARPETNAFLVRRFVEGHLGKKSDISAHLRDQERVKIQRARETKKMVAQLKEDAWEGNI